MGDDWYGDDPTVNRLQDAAAELTGKEAALYLPTGTMCNQIALHAFVRPGRFVVCEATAHIGGTEAGSAATLSGIAFRRVAARERGLLTPTRSRPRCSPIRTTWTWWTWWRIENTHQVGGGSVLPVDGLAAISGACAAAGTPLYLDGARIFNACAVTGAAWPSTPGTVDAMMFCLSKGLGAPIGSLLTGDAEFIREARRLKMLFGAAWRQAGLMAAAGLIALRDGPGRLAEDHANAQRLARGDRGDHCRTRWTRQPCRPTSCSST